MECKKLNEVISVAGQISDEDVEAIVKAGFRSILCNRPDSEAGAVAHERIRKKAQEEGLAFLYLPVASGAILPENVADMKEALESLPKPIFAYCRSGGRCASLYNLAAS